MGVVSELRRRNVFRMAVLYVVAAWAVMQAAEVVIGLANLPDWLGPTILTVLAIGLPIALFFSWFFEVTPEGLSLEKDVPEGKSITHATGRRMDFVIIAILSAGLILFAYDKWWIGPPPEKSIAVLAFENVGGDPEQEYFSDGLSDTLIHALAQVSDLKVMAKTSSFYFKGKNIDVGEIGRQLKVSTILEGSVQRADNRVRVIVQLVNTADGTHRWSKRFDRNLQDIFAVQDEIAQEVVKALEVTLSLAEQDRLQIVPTENMAALEAYFLGRQHMAGRATVALAEAVDNFRHATELDPEFALAYVGLADSYALLSVYGGLPREEGFPRAEAAIDKALELDNQLGEAYASLGYLKWQKSRWKWRANDLQGAELALKRSLELSPNYATAHLWYGGLMFSMGRWEDALVETRKAQYLDPLSVIINQEVGWYLEILGRFDEALLLYEKIIEIDPTDPGGYRKLAIWHRNSGKLDEAVIWFRKTVAVDPDSPTFPAYLGQVYLDLGDDREAEYWIRRSLQLGPERLEPNYAMFSLHVYRGDEAEALDLARKALMGDTLLFYPDKHVFQADRYTGALARIEYYRPELLHDDEPNVDRTNYPEAIRIASVLLEIGERKRANQLLDRSLMTIQGVQRLGGYGYGIADVLIYALRGEPNTALTLLRQAFNEGWRKEWWWVERLYILDSIRDEPEFQAIMDEIRSDMAVQLERVRALEASGELEPIPDIN